MLSAEVQPMNGSLYRYDYYYGPLSFGRSGRAMGCWHVLM